jgi:nucleoid-associated protein YgaU
VASLTAHLTAGTEHGRLSFHPLCPRCRDERVSGSIDCEVLVSRRAQALLAAGVLAVSTATPTVSVAAEADQEQEGEAVPPPDGSTGGTLDDPAFDPGGDDTPLDVDAGAPTEIPDGGDDIDDGAEATPVEREELDDPEGRLVLVEQPTEVPPAGGNPEVDAPPAVPQTDVTEQTPAPSVIAPEGDLPSKPMSERGREGRDGTRPTPRRTRTRVDQNTEQPAPVMPNAPAPSTHVAVAAAPPVAVATVQVADPAGGAGAPVRGSRYVVREGDSLWSIAKRLLGSNASNGQVAREVSRLWRLNEERIGTGDPGRVHVGTVLKVR